MSLICKAVGAACGMLAVVALAPPVFAQPVPPAGEQASPAAQPAGAPPPQVAPPQVAPPQVAPADAQPPGGPPPQAAPLHQGLTRSAWATANVNLRSGPGTDAQIIATVPGGSTLRITSCSGEWCAVTWNGQSGYAIARNLSTGQRRVRQYRPQPYYEGEPQAVYGPPVYYPPPVVYAPGFYYGPRPYYGRGFYYGRGWGRRW